jgi:hypothetical protein
MAIVERHAAYTLDKRSPRCFANVGNNGISFCVIADIDFYLDQLMTKQRLFYLIDYRFTHPFLANGDDGVKLMT